MADVNLLDLAARIRVDMGDSVRNLTATQKTVLQLADQFKKTEAAATEAAQKSAAALQTARVSTRAFSMGVESATSAVNTLAVAAKGLLVLFVANELRQGAAAWLDYSSKLESTTIAFTTMMGSAQLADQHLKELQRFALTTPFQFDELIAASQRMQALGFNAQQVVPILTDVGNAVAAAGGGGERLDRVVLALSQIQSKGKLATQEINQLAESGIPAWKMLEEQLGKSRVELVKMVEQGEVSSAVFLEAFQKFSQQNFGGLMEEQSKTFTGAMSNIKDALLQTSQTAFKPLYERISEIAIELSKTSTSSKELQKNMEAAGRGIIQVWDGVVVVFHVVRDVIGLVSAVAIQVFGGITHVILATVEAVRGFLFGLQAVSQFMAGNFRGALEQANKSTQATENAANELTQALKAQGAVAEQVVRIWENAEARKAAASISAAQKIAQASLGYAPELKLEDMVGAGILRKKVPGVPSGGGGGGGGGAKRDTAATSAQSLLNSLLDEYNRAQAKAQDLTKVEIVQQELLKSKYQGTSKALIELRQSILDVATSITIDAQETERLNVIKERMKEALDRGNRAAEEQVNIENMAAEATQRLRDELSELQFGQETNVTAAGKFAARLQQMAEETGGMTDETRRLIAELLKLSATLDQVTADKATSEKWRKIGEKIGFPDSGDYDKDERRKEEERMRGIQDMARDITSALDSAIYEGFRGGVKRGLASMLESMLQMINNIMLKQIEQGLTDLLSKVNVNGGAGGGKSGIFGAIFGAIFSGIGGLFGGGGGSWGKMGGKIGFPTPVKLARGMDFVPFDNFPALLHRGERVVPAEQNGMGGNVVVNMTVVTPNAQSFGGRDTQAQISRQMQTVMKQAAVRVS